MVGVTGIEPVTPSMSTKCSPAELHAHCRCGGRRFRAKAHDPQPEAVRITGLPPKNKIEPTGGKGLLSRHQPLDLGDQIAEMEGFGQHLGVFGGMALGVQRNGGKTRDEHDLQRRIEFGGAPGKFDPVHFRHDDIGQQDVENIAFELRMGEIAPSERLDDMPCIFKSFRQKAAHGFIVFRK